MLRPGTILAVILQIYSAWPSSAGGAGPERQKLTADVHRDVSTAMRAVSEAPWLKEGEWREVVAGMAVPGVKTLRPRSNENFEAKFHPATDVVLLLAAYSDSTGARAEFARRGASIPRDPILDLVIEAADEVSAWEGFARKDQVVIHFRLAQFVVGITAPGRETAESVARSTAQTISRLSILKR